MTSLRTLDSRQFVRALGRLGWVVVRPVVDERTVAVGSILRKTKDKLRYDRGEDREAEAREAAARDAAQERANATALSERTARLSRRS